MDQYKKAILLLSIVVTIPCSFLVYVGLVADNMYAIVFWSGIILLWWSVYLYVRRNRPISFWISFILVNLFWWPLLVKSVSRLVFVIENRGMERADGAGSPLAFLVGLIFEQFFFLPLSLALFIGLKTLKKSWK